MNQYKEKVSDPKNFPRDEYKESYYECQPQGRFYSYGTYFGQHSGEGSDGASLALPGAQV